METANDGNVGGEIGLDASAEQTPPSLAGSDVVAVNGTNEVDAIKQQQENVDNDNEMDTSENDGQWNQNSHHGGSNFQGKSFNTDALRGSAPPFGRPAPHFTNRAPGPYDANWQHTNQNANASASGNAPQVELWVETKTDDGKSYYYHALTRETTWNRPEGPNVKCLTQSEIEDMNKKQQQQQQMPPNNTNDVDTIGAGAEHNTEQAKDGLTAIATNVGDAALTTHPPPNMQSMSHPPPNVNTANAPPLTQQPPPSLHQQPPPFFQPGMHPPNFQQPPFGMPPPYGTFPGGPAPWAMPWQHAMQQHVPPSQQEKPAKNLIIKPGVIDPAVIARAAEWSEHRAPDGRPYYYHGGRGESVWEKPQALRDMEAARMAAHSGATPQQAAPPPQQAAPTMPPHMLQNPLMHVPPNAGGPYDPTMAYNAAAAAAAAAAATLKANENSKAQAAAMEKENKKAAEEKRKKEEEQKKNAAAAAKPVDKSRPISSTPIAGTPWCVVWTGDARVFFYNPSTRTSVWERPDDLLDREDVDKAVSNAPEQLKNVIPVAANAKDEKSDVLPAEKSKTANALSTPAVVAVEEYDDNDDEIIKIRTESESSVEEVPTKKGKITTKLSKKTDANEAAVEAEVRAAKERALVPLETRVKQFKEMLREKDVSAFSTWEKELHKIVFDPRYLLLTSKERKQVFEKYVKDRAEEERKEKRNKMRQKREDFRKLMEDAKLHGKSSFSDFCQRYGKDERYKAIEKVRERESLFNEYIVDVRRREKEEKLMKKEQIRKEFIEMLRERCSDIDRHTRWYDIKKKFEADSRYRAVENSMYREEYFQDYMRIMKDEKRKQREQKDREREQREREREKDRKLERKDKERNRDRSRSRDKTRIDKDRDNKDSRDRKKEKEKEKDKEKEKEKERERDREKERNGNERKCEKHEDSDEGEHHDDEDEQQQHSGSGDDDEVERLQKEREKQLRAEQSIREREKEVQRTLAGHLRDRDKEREHHKRDEAIGHFNALLTDLVRNPDFTWKEVKRQLRKDHRWEMIETLDREDREKIFNEHIDSLMKKKREKFREMLDEISTLELISSWKDIKKLVKEDPRYLKYNNSDKCEREFRDYIKDKILQAKAALRELLQECKLITHKSIELVKENPNHLKEIQDILKNDKRYLVLEHMADERSTIVVSYLEELHKRGPPPPPTASESTRRNK